MRKINICFPIMIAVFFCCLSIGCSKKPAGFPRVYPCTIIVTKGGQPLEGAIVALIPESSEGQWAAAAKTDSNGVAKISTGQLSYSVEGAPIGKHKVTIAKALVPPSKLPDSEVAMMRSHSEKMAYGAKIAKELASMKPIVEANLSNPAETPLVIEISNAPVTVTFDVDEHGIKSSSK